MLAHLQLIAQRLDDSIQQLHEKSTHALPTIQSALDLQWPTLRRPKDQDEDAFEQLKKNTWTTIKNSLSNFCKQSLSLPADLLQKDLAKLALEDGPLETLLTLTAQFRNAYAAAKRLQNRLDFADLERFTLNLLTAPNNPVAPELHHQYKYLLVDEFQDINPLQAALLHAIRSPDAFHHTGNLFIVGDIKQSIYGFRLADPNLFLTLEKSAKAATTSQRYINLPHNFRSDPHLLTTMNAIFEKILTPELTGITYNDGHALAPPPEFQVSSFKFQEETRNSKLETRNSIL